MAAGSQKVWTGAEMFDLLRGQALNILLTSGHVIYSGIPTYEGMHRRGRWHFQGTWQNKRKMAHAILSLVTLQNWVANARRNTATVIATDVGNDYVEDLLGCMKANQGVSWEPQDVVQQAEPDLPQLLLVPPQKAGG